MADNLNALLLVPQDVMRRCAERARALRIGQRITQRELAKRLGVAEGTIKRFERTGEAQFRTLLGIALVLGRLPDFADVFKEPDVPASLYHPGRGPETRERARRRARKKCD